MKHGIKKGDIISLVDEQGKTFLINTDNPTDLYRGVGVIDPSTFIGSTYGTKQEIGNKMFCLLPVSLPDTLKGLKRNAQIILPKDAAQIIINCSITPGKTVLEAGIGSGSLTLVLATMVGPEGNVISYDLREDFIKHAHKNLKNSGLAANVTIKQMDVTEQIEETDLDAVILDIPNPWDAVHHAWKALSPGGYLCCYSPLISQMEQTVHTIRKHPFILERTIETIERDMVVSDRGTRPSFQMLGHTGYLTFARKIL
jgi:tRNA (adenine57-N1/adenine58-N1)-methyltransferase